MQLNHQYVFSLALLLLSSPLMAECRISLAPPYTGALMIDSKYDQSDATKSKLADASDLEGWDSKAKVEAFNRQMVQFANAYIQRDSAAHKSMALSCMTQSMTNWASANALLTRQINPTGRAVRKWSLAALASTLHKTLVLSNGDFELTAVHEAWLAKVADQVIADYTPRQHPDFEYFNNHDYWAAWAVVATGMILDSDEYRRWGYNVFDMAMQQIVLSNTAVTGWLPNETGRGSLGAEYTHYAITPLALLANHAEENRHSLNRDQTQRLQALATFAVVAALRPTALEQLKGKQRQVPNHKLTWLIPFLDQFPEHTPGLILYFQHGGSIDGYGQVGGIIAPLYKLPSKASKPSANSLASLLRTLP